LIENVYRFISDPGHGWLEVPEAELSRLNIADKISAYSYRNAGNAYLEEDSDFGVFKKAKDAAGETFKLEEVYQENTPIRNYSRFGA
jgi:hypothetical protein